MYAVSREFWSPEEAKGLAPEVTPDPSEVLTDSGKSEVQLQPELDLARVIGAVDLSKISVAKTSRNRVEGGVVEEVEELRPELIVQPFSDLAVLVEGEIPVPRAGSPHRVPPCVAKCARRRLREELGEIGRAHV